MRPSSLGFLVAMAGLAMVSVAEPSRAGGLSDLVGYGAQDVYLSPPASAPAASANSPKAAANALGASANAPEATGQTDAGGATVHQTRKPIQLRLSKDCRKAGFKTREECDVFHAAQANKPADVVLPADSQGSVGVAIVEPGQPAKASTGQTPAASAGNPPSLRITSGMGGTSYSN